MKEKIKNFIKKNIKGFVVGLVFTLVVGAVSAEIIFNSSDLSYTPPLNNVGNITTVQQALDVLYRLKPETYYYAFGDPTTSSPTDYTAMTHRVFVRQSADNIGTANKEVCIVRNGELGCFKNGTANWASNQYLIQAFFSDLTCTNTSDTFNTVACYDGSSDCHVHSDGRVYCYGDAGDELCYVDASGTVYCA